MIQSTAMRLEPVALEPHAGSQVGNWSGIVFDSMDGEEFGRS